MERRMSEFTQFMPEKVVPDLSAMVMAPMPGMVKNVAVSEGQNVSFTLYFNNDFF